MTESTLLLTLAGENTLILLSKLPVTSDEAFKPQPIAVTAFE